MAGLLGLGGVCLPAHASGSELIAAPKLYTMVYGGEIRHVWLYVPPGGRPGGPPRPLLFALHGWTQTAIAFAANTGFHRLAARKRFIVAYPYGRAGRWHMERRPAGAPDDDVGFIRAITKRIDTRIAAVDRTRIYAVGFSMGGVLSLRLACEASDLFAGVAAISTTLPAKLAPGCRPNRPVTVLMIHGTLDPVSPYSGGRLAVFGQPPLRLLSVKATAQIFARAQGCAAAVSGRLTSARSPGSRLVRRWYYPGCARGQVEIWALPGQGHTWPRVMINATKETWRHLSAARK